VKRNPLDVPLKLTIKIVGVKERDMRRSFIKLSLVPVILILVAAGTAGAATVEWNIQNTLKTDAVPIDVAVSADGKSIFVLTEDGKILIYDSDGELTETIKVGAHVDRISIGPGEEQLVASSRKNKTVEVINLTFIRNINTQGSPFKGPENAPVVITVFSDFQ